MKLQVLQENLAKALTTASRFASTKAQLPVLGNVLLLAQKTKLSISATNLETSISISIGAQVEEEGKITVPARIITDVISNLPSGAIDLLEEKEQLKIKAQNFQSVLSAMNASDFPAIPQSVGKNSLVLEKGSFIQALSQVTFAASIDETRPVLTGILFLFKKKKLILVATDGFRLSQKTIEIKGIDKEFSVILPKTALSELSRLTSEEETIRFSFRKEDNQVVFGINQTILSSRVLEGTFPDFEKIIPKQSNIKIELDREEFLRAVKLSSVFAREAANVVQILVKKGAINLSAESQTAGSQKTSVDAKVEGEIDKDGFKIAFNWRFLEDFLGAVQSDDVRIELSSPNAPGVFVDAKDPAFLHLIMPVRLQE